MSETPSRMLRRPARRLFSFLRTDPTLWAVLTVALCMLWLGAPG